ncbi:MAG: hypothetical protein ACOX5J_09215 [Candidatus Hydrogenedentales bacterium]
MSDQDPLSHVKRDAEALFIIGLFLVFLAAIVLVATIFQAPGHARVVNGTAGLVLMLIGAAMAGWSRVLRKRFTE